MKLVVQTWRISVRFSENFGGYSGNGLLNRIIEEDEPTFERHGKKIRFLYRKIFPKNSTADSRCRSWGHSNRHSACSHCLWWISCWDHSLKQKQTISMEIRILIEMNNYLLTCGSIVWRISGASHNTDRWFQPKMSWVSDNWPQLGTQNKHRLYWASLRSSTASPDP